MDVLNRRIIMLNAKQYDEALDRINELGGPAFETPEWIELRQLLDLVEEYEDIVFPMDPIPYPEKG